MTEPSTKNFPTKELRCQCHNCEGEVPNECDMFALHMLQKIRDRVGALPLNSAYRCPKHPEEAVKAKPGHHSKGCAFDIRVPWGEKRMRIVAEALKLGAKGFGFYEWGVHVDWRLRSEPTSWGG